MNKNFFKITLPVAALTFPIFCFAAKDLHDIIEIVVGYLQTGVTLIIGLAIVTFVFNVYRYFFYETEKRKEAGLYVLYSTIGFFVILSIWGLVALLSNTFKLNNNRPDWPFGAGGGTPSGITTYPSGYAPTDSKITTYPSGYGYDPTGANSI